MSTLLLCIFYKDAIMLRYHFEKDNIICESADMLTKYPSQYVMDTEGLACHKLRNIIITNTCYLYIIYQT